MLAVAPRSTWSHCGSLNALAHRVPALPSTAPAAGKAALSDEEAVTGLACDSRLSAAMAGARVKQDVITMIAVATSNPKRKRLGLREELTASPRQAWGFGERSRRPRVRFPVRGCQGPN